MRNAHPARLGRLQKWCIYGCWAALLLTGLLWLAFHYFVVVHNDFGEGYHPLESWWLKSHGLAAMAMLVLFGTMMPVHIRKAWRAGESRWTGASMVAVMAVLALTGYALYYFGGEETRPWISSVHWIVGLAGLPTVLIHVWQGHRKTPRTQKQHGHVRGAKTETRPLRSA
jgi:hypothetical protein